MLRIDDKCIGSAFIGFGVLLAETLVVSSPRARLMFERPSSKHERFFAAFSMFYEASLRRVGLRFSASNTMACIEEKIMIMAKRKAPPSIFLTTLFSMIIVSFPNTLALSLGFTRPHSSTFQLSNYISRRRISSSHNRQQRTTLSMDINDGGTVPGEAPLCDLQTFLRMCDLVDSGGQAKIAIQNSKCLLNGTIEVRRSKKLFHGDKVTFGSTVDLDVSTEVKKKGYLFKPKVKKLKPLPKVDDEGNLEFGGRYRSEEWRAERKVKKADRKKKNTTAKLPLGSARDKNEWLR
ncbi:hypothetical protein ACHAW5_004992 [Stephanodiscus triporus]|uniref:RNA-binding S4 domain-containing protein n=1 Tax=Stephanodiscus triporus TaxID=2934178 RepID=A0ABD3MBL4_9STRA